MTIIRATRPPTSSPNSRLGALVLALAIGVLMAVPPIEARSETAAGVLLLAQAAPSLGPDQVAALVREASGGRILDVRLERGASSPVYRVKVLLDGGRVRVYRVDATSGRILE